MAACGSTKSEIGEQQRGTSGRESGVLRCNGGMVKLWGETEWQLETLQDVSEDQE